MEKEELYIALNHILEAIENRHNIQAQNLVEELINKIR